MQTGMEAGWQAGRLAVRKGCRHGCRQEWRNTGKQVVGEVYRQSEWKGGQQAVRPAWRDYSLFLSI